MMKWKQFLCGLTGHWWELVTVDFGWKIKKAQIGRCKFCGKKKLFKEVSTTKELIKYLEWE